MIPCPTHQRHLPQGSSLAPRGVPRRVVAHRRRLTVVARSSPSTTPPSPSTTTTTLAQKATALKDFLSPISSSSRGSSNSTSSSSTPPSATALRDDQTKGSILALVGLTSAVSFICSIDRAAMSIAILPMSADFDWSDDVKGLVSSAFFAGYTITNLAGGVLATRYSAKAVLAAGVAAWSLFTVATPSAAAASLPQLLVVRALMGVGEGVAYPSVQNIVRDSVPESARSRSLAFIYSGHQVGTLASYVLAPIVIQRAGWPAVFTVFGSLGFAWLAAWAPLLIAERAAAQNQASEGGSSVRRALAAISPRALLQSSTTIRQQEQEKQKQQLTGLKDVPWGAIATNSSFWAIVAAQVSVGIGSCLAFSWLPTYYSEVYHLDVASSAAYCIAPFVATVCTTNLAGWIADGLVNSGTLSKTQTRKLMQLIASLGPAACLLRLAGGAQDGATLEAWDAVASVTAWLALGGFSAAGFGSNHQDISGKWAGVLFGLSNGLASIAGSASIYATGVMLHRTHSDWGLIFEGAAAVYILGAAVYWKWASAEEQL